MAAETDLRQLENLRIKVDGRTFLPAINLTFEQDLYVMDKMALSGMDALGAADISADDDLSEVAQQVILQAYRSGRLFEILAGALEEEGVEWTADAAGENAKFFAGLRQKEDKEALQGALAGIVLGFFFGAAGRSGTSQKFSARPGRKQKAGEPAVGAAPSQEVLAALGTGESGTASSGNSEGMTPTDTA